MTKDELEKAIRNFYGDTSRSQAETKDALEEMGELCSELADTLDGEDE